MQPSPFYTDHVAEIPMFDGAIHPNDLSLPVKQTDHIGKRVCGGFPFLLCPLDLEQTFFQGGFCPRAFGRFVLKLRIILLKFFV